MGEGEGLPSPSLKPKISFFSPWPSSTFFFLVVLGFDLAVAAAFTAGFGVGVGVRVGVGVGSGVDVELGDGVGVGVGVGEGLGKEQLEFNVSLVGEHVPHISPSGNLPNEMPVPGL